ncbi:hypothetical protein LUZ60_016481 [Juncus effusus]|nr:hypothetical protein LUZ60_016481 [Juncus effusus]
MMHPIYNIHQTCLLSKKKFLAIQKKVKRNLNPIYHTKISMAKMFINIIPFAILMLQFLLLMQLTTADQSIISKPDCPEKCGEVMIPYPFGIGPNCSLQGFQISCNKTSYGTYTPLFLNQTLLNVSLPLGQFHVNNPISSQCYNNTIKNDSYNDWEWNFYSSPFQFNHEKNKFTVIGCDTLAYLHIYGSSWYWGGCVSVCYSLESLTNGSCSGIGCCQTAIPKGTNYYRVRFDTNFNNSQVYNFSQCGYAVLMEDAGFEFNTRYITTDELYKRGEMPMVLDWTIGNQTCEIAQSNKSSYACVSENSVCVDSTIYNGALGYLCNCSVGYEGNPYLTEGCQDINECNRQSICGDKICRNTLGGFECLCPSGTHNTSHSNGSCIPNQKLALWVKLVIGICVGLMILLICFFYTYMANERRKLAKIKEKYFQQYGGRLLLEEMHSKHGQSFTIFSEEELKQATNNFDETNMIGEGGNGTVYKGTLKSNSAVAIKRCKTIDERQKKEFGKEMLILSQINHKNIVRIRGCCLEVEIPILVYEIISNGTLSNLIHAKHASRISLGTRLRIAKEAAEALAYLHSWASPPIVHRDVKSSNILLDENFMAKVSDFGASVLAPVDQEQCFTVMQGTRGYLDPEYL